MNKIAASLLLHIIAPPQTPPSYYLYNILFELVFALVSVLGGLGENNALFNIINLWMKSEINNNMK